MNKIINFFKITLVLNNVASASDNSQEDDLSNILSRFCLSNRNEGPLGNIGNIVSGRTDDLRATTRETISPLFNNQSQQYRLYMDDYQTDYASSYTSRYAPLAFHSTELSTTDTLGATGFSETPHVYRGAKPKNPNTKKKRKSTTIKTNESYNNEKKLQLMGGPVSSVDWDRSSLSSTSIDDDLTIPEVEQIIDTKEILTSKGVVCIILTNYSRQYEENKYLPLEEKKHNIRKALKKLTYENLINQNDMLLAIIKSLARIAEKHNVMISKELIKARNLKKKYSKSPGNECIISREVFTQNYQNRKAFYISFYDKHFEQRKDMLKIYDDLQLIESEDEEIGKNRRERIRLNIKMFDKSIEICDNQIKKIDADLKQILKSLAD